MENNETLHIDFPEAVVNSVGVYVKWAQSQAKQYGMNRKDPAVLNFFLSLGLNLTDAEYDLRRSKMVGGGTCCQQVGSPITD